MPAAGIKMKIAGMCPPVGCYTYAPEARSYMEQFTCNKILRAVIKVIFKPIYALKHESVVKLLSLLHCNNEKKNNSNLDLEWNWKIVDFQIIK